MTEVRNFENEVRLLPDSRHVEGYAIVTGVESRDLGGFTEIISPDALTDDVITSNEILCVLNHNADRGILARSIKGNGSLKLEIDSKGLKYSFDAPLTALGDELLEGIRRGDITTSSFRFNAADRTWEHKGDKYITTVNKFARVSDVSPVYIAAYDDTTVTVRAFEEYKAEEQKQLDEVKAKEKEELTNYYKELREKIQ